ncbi:phage shock protein B [Bacillus sp. 1780r2a1]|nr:phage shock protein B [Bacillus sp. 1780r2a1]
MGLLIVSLLGIAIVLLILSFRKTKQAQTHTDQQLEQLTLTIGQEMNELNDRIRTLEIDAAITAEKSGVLGLESPERKDLRNMIDMHKRGYSSESIAGRMKGYTQQEVEQMLAPYTKKKDEGSMMA